MERAEPKPVFAPLRKAVEVSRPPAEAFAIFTERIAAWWPLAKGYSVYGADAATCRIEPRVGGAVSEHAKDGRTSVWGTVLAWEPPHRFVMTWHPGREPDTAQEVEVRFVGIRGVGTRVELEHRGWESLGTKAAETRAQYDGGWAVVFDIHFKEACA